MMVGIQAPTVLAKYMSFQVQPRLAQVDAGPARALPVARLCEFYASRPQVREAHPEARTCFLQTSGCKYTCIYTYVLIYVLFMNTCRCTHTCMYTFLYTCVYIYMYRL